jgi:hypothetical protein
MSAPDTNIAKQEKNHRPSLIGIKGALMFCLLALLAVVGFNLINADDSIPAGIADGGVTTVPTDVYEPGTNSAATPAAAD